MLDNEDLREELATAQCLDTLFKVASGLKKRFDTIAINSEHSRKLLSLYYCQPYVRPKPKQQLNKSDQKRSTSEDETSSETKISKKKLKRMKRGPVLKVNKDNIRILCVKCKNPRNGKCNYQLCKTCCKSKSYKEVLDCLGKFPRISFSRYNLFSLGHRFQFKTRQELKQLKLSAE